VADTAGGGTEALGTFAASAPGTYKLILMDIQMPDMDGYECTRRIRAMERADAQSVRIIAVTADAYKETQEQAEEAGMNGYVTKPLNPDRVADLLGGVRDVMPGEV